MSGKRLLERVAATMLMDVLPLIQRARAEPAAKIVHAGCVFDDGPEWVHVLCVEDVALAELPRALGEHRVDHVAILARLVEIPRAEVPDLLPLEVDDAKDSPLRHRARSIRPRLDNQLLDERPGSGVLHLLSHISLLSSLARLRVDKAVDTQVDTILTRSCCENQAAPGSA